MLTQHDVGKAYRLNVNASGPRALSDVILADSGKIVAAIKHSWLGGEETAYNGVSVPWGIISLADVFRSSSSVATVLPAWVHDAVTISKGTRLALPLGIGAPGAQGALVRGSLAGYETLIYMWRHGRTIASVDVTGKSNVPLGLLITLARQQDAQITTR